MMPLIRLLLVALACLPAAMAWAQPAPAWIDSTGRLWHADDRGLAFFEVEQTGVVHRVYADPVRYQIARSVEQHLSQVGFPARCEVPVIDRRLLNRCRYSPCGQVFSEDAHLQSMLDAVDWPAAVRQAVRGAVIRGFNAMEVAPEVAGGQSRSEADNSLPPPAAVPGDPLQLLVEQGVEDALIDAFNQLQVTPGEILPTPARKAEQIAPADVAEPARDRVADHLAEQPQKLLEDRKYDRFETIVAGWFVDHDGSIKPLSLKSPLVVAYLEARHQRADLWQNGEALHTYVLYARYYEDAVALKREFY